MSRKNTLTLAARRQLAAVKTQARNRYQGISARIDLNRQGLLATSMRRARAGDPTVAPQYWHKLPAKVRPVAERIEQQRQAQTIPAKVATAEGQHVTRVTPLADKFVGTCSCGAWTSKPMGEAHAKGAATRHRNAMAAVVAAA